MDLGEQQERGAQQRTQNTQSTHNTRSTSTLEDAHTQRGWQLHNNEYKSVPAGGGRERFGQWEKDRVTGLVKEWAEAQVQGVLHAAAQAQWALQAAQRTQEAGAGAEQDTQGQGDGESEQAQERQESKAQRIRRIAERQGEERRERWSTYGQGKRGCAPWRDAQGGQPQRREEQGTVGASRVHCHDSGRRWLAQTAQVHVAQMETREQEEVGVETVEMFEGVHTKYRSTKVTMGVMGTTHDVLVDSGASFSIASEEYLRGLQASTRTRITRQRLRHGVEIQTAAQGGKLWCTEQVQLDLKVGTGIIQQHFLVARMHGTILLGLDFLAKHKVVLDFNAGVVRMGGQFKLVAPMIVQVKVERRRWSGVTRLLLSADVQLDKYHGAVGVPVRCENRHMRDISALGLVGSSSYASKLGVFAARGVLRCAGGNARVHLANLSEKTVFVPKGTVVAVWQVWDENDTAALHTAQESVVEDDGWDTQHSGQVKKLVVDEKARQDRERDEEEKQKQNLERLVESLMGLPKGSWTAPSLWMSCTLAELMEHAVVNTTPPGNTTT